MSIPDQTDTISRLVPPLHSPGDTSGAGEDRESTPLETARGLALAMRQAVQDRLALLRAQRGAINDEIRELVEEEARLTSMVRASEAHPRKKVTP